MSDFLHYAKDIALLIVGVVSATIYFLGLFRQCIKIWFEEKFTYEQRGE